MRKEYDDRLSRWERYLIVGLGLFVLVFGWIVLQRSAYMQDRHTDAGVYFRAAWAIQSGESIYQVRDDNGMPYVSTPFLAMLLTPLADPPTGTPSGKRGYSLSYPVSVVVNYLLSVAAIFAAMHILASAIESQSRNLNLRDHPRYGRRWWTLRALPIIVCAPMVGSTLSRGQPTHYILLCIVLMTVAFMRGRSVLAGWWLAAAVCIKVFPAYLVLYPLWRRDLRCLLACAAGLMVGFLVLPAVIMGPARTIATYQEYVRFFLYPAFSGVDSIGNARWWDEIYGHTQSFKAVFFRLTYPDPMQRPAVIPRVFWVVHITLSIVVMIVSLRAAGWTRRQTPLANGTEALISLLFAGVLITGVLPMIPASRDHYFSLGTILVMALLAVGWRHTDRFILPSRWIVLFSAIFLFQLAVQTSRIGVVDDLGNVIWAEMLLWSAGIYQLWKLTQPRFATRPLHTANTRS